METLKMIVDDVSWIKIESTTKYEDVPEKERDNNSWWYLHGELESITGYDKATAINCYSLGISKETLHWSSISGRYVGEVFDEEPYFRMYFNGIIPVEVEGIDKKCIGYFWTTDEHDILYKGRLYSYWCQRGLVCCVDDLEACKYAEKKMNERSLIL